MSTKRRHILYDVTSPGQKRKYPPGKRVQMTEAWKKRVAERMHQLGIDKAELARRLGVDKSGLGKLLTTATSSKLVPQICELLDLPLPMQEIDGPPSEIDELIKNMPAENKPRALAILRAAGLL